MQGFYSLGNFLQNFCLHRSIIEVYLFSGGQPEDPIMIIILNSFPAMAKNLQEFLPRAIETFQHICCNFPNSPNDDQGISFLLANDLFRSCLLEQPAHFPSNWILFIGEYFVVHVGGGGFQTINILMVVWPWLCLISWVIVPGEQIGRQRIIFNYLVHLLDLIQKLLKLVIAIEAGNCNPSDAFVLLCADNQ